MINNAEVERAWLKHKNISMFHCNIRSIKKNLDQLLIYLSQHSFQYDIIAITETWLKEDECVNIPGYVMLSQPRAHATRGGGVAMFIRNELSFQRLTDISSTQQSAETLFATIECGVIAGVVYRPPSSSVDDFISVMESVLHQCVTSHSQIIISGDFNIDLLKDQCHDYLFLLQSFNLRNVITK